MQLSNSNATRTGVLFVWQDCLRIPVTDQKSTTFMYCVIKELKQQIPFILRQCWYDKKEGVIVVHLYALAGTSETNTCQRLRIHSNTPSSYLCWNYYLLSPIEVSTEITGEASRTCVHKQYSCYSHTALCKYIIIHTSIYIWVYIYMYVMAAGTDMV